MTEKGHLTLYITELKVRSLHLYIDFKYIYILMFEEPNGFPWEYGSTLF